MSSTTRGDYDRGAPDPPEAHRPPVGDFASPSRPPARESVAHPELHELAAAVADLSKHLGQYLLGLVAYLPRVGTAEAMVVLAGLEEIRRGP